MKIIKHLEREIEKGKQRELAKVMEFCGVLDGETKELTSQEIKYFKKTKYLSC